MIIYQSGNEISIISMRVALETFFRLVQELMEKMNKITRIMPSALEKVLRLYTLRVLNMRDGEK